MSTLRENKPLNAMVKSEMTSECSNLHILEHTKMAQQSGFGSETESLSFSVKSPVVTKQRECLAKIKAKTE